jgi:hypothetical protein
MSRFWKLFITFFVALLAFFAAVAPAFAQDDVTNDLDGNTLHNTFSGSENNIDINVEMPDGSHPNVHGYVNESNELVLTNPMPEAVDHIDANFTVDGDGRITGSLVITYDEELSWAQTHGTNNHPTPTSEPPPTEPPSNIPPDGTPTTDTPSSSPTDTSVNTATEVTNRTETPAATQTAEFAEETEICEDCIGYVCSLAPGKFVEVALHYIGIDDDGTPHVFETYEEGIALGLQFAGQECSYCMTYLINKEDQTAFIARGATEDDIALGLAASDGRIEISEPDRQAARRALFLYNANVGKPDWYSYAD